MFLRKMKNKKTGRIYLSIVHSYRDKETKKTRSKTIKSLGYVDELQQEYEDPIAHFEEEVQTMKQSQQEKQAPLSMDFHPKTRLQQGETNRKNLGYAALSKIYHELDLHTFLKNRQRHTKSDYDANNIMKLLIYGRLLYPSSKRHTYEIKDRFFERTDFSLDDVYRCLSFLSPYKDDLQHWIHQRIQEQYGRNTSLVYYDVTNYYFEIDDQDELRRKGVSKEHRPDPIIQMGLFMDTDGIPITYGLHPGNMLDKQTFIPMIREIQKHFHLGRTIVVADRGMTTGDNIWYTLSANNGYILSYSVRGANRAFKEYVLNQDGYRAKGEDFQIKSRLEPREITVTSRNGKKIKKQVDEKQVVFYSRKYAQKAKADREYALQKARDLVQHPSKYNKATTYGAAKYVKNLGYDKKTGEILEDRKEALLFDEEKLRKEEALDGYYAIITSEYQETDEKIIDLYRGLWKIEESFKITKSDISSRPVYVSKREHIESHFLTCFVSLVIARLLEKRLQGKYAVKPILESLRNASCSHLQENYFVLDTFDDVLEDVKDKLGIDLGQKYMSLKEIKKMLGNTKTS